MNICIIPARGGSQRIPGKNIRTFHGRPIIEYSIEAAQQHGHFTQIIVSTDDDAIAHVATTAGAKLHERSALRSQDSIGTQEVAMEVLVDVSGMDDFHGKHNLACVLYPTAPMIDEWVLRSARAHLMNHYEAMFAMGVGTTPLRDAGQFYYGRVAAFINLHPLISPQTVMIPIDESRVCDINLESDWMRAEKMYDKLRRG